MNNKTLLVCGLGNSQVDLARTAREAGYRVVGAGAGSVGPATEFCDDVIDCNILDVEALRAAACDSGADALFTLGMEKALMPMALVSEQLDLPTFFSVEVLSRLTDKGAWRALLGNAPGNLPFALGTTMDDFKHWTDYPAIVKPVDGSGQRGVCRVDDADSLALALPRALAFSSSSRAIVEPFAQGSEISANVLLAGGKRVFCLLSDRESYEDLPGGIVKSHAVPSRFQSPQLQHAVEELVDRVVDSVGFSQGPLYFQMKTTGSDLALIEFTPRFDGCHMWRLIKEATGVDLLRATLDLLFEGHTDELDCWKGAVNPHELRFFSAPPASTVCRGDFALEPHVSILEWYYAEGATVKSVTGVMEKVGYRILKKD